MKTRIARWPAIVTVLIPVALLAQAVPETKIENGTLPAPSEQEKAARVFVGVAPYRYDDLLWENDRTAHRIYGKPLEAYEPPSTSGIDAWGKNVRWPFMERQLKSGHQHDYHGEGLDSYNVKTSRGAGGLGIWLDNKLWTSRNYVRPHILNSGPDIADFSVDYDPWPVGTNRKVWETRRFTLPAGTNFTRMVSTIRSDKAGPLIVGIGIAKRSTSDTQLGTLHADRKTGKFSWWGPADADRGTMAVALMINPALITDVKEDADNYLVLLTIKPGAPFVYYMGATWDRSADFHSEAEWQSYVNGQSPDFDPKH